MNTGSRGTVEAAQLGPNIGQGKLFLGVAELAQCVLIVEDDVMIADCLEEFLLEAGYDICGITGSVAEAIRLGEQYKPDLAVIDLRLAGSGLGVAIAGKLSRSAG
jgi:ActR/RegA family two-component response regulator